MNKPIYFVLNIDNNYINQATVTITSVVNNINKNYKCIFFLFTRNINKFPKQFLELENKYNIKINCIDTIKYRHYFKNINYKDNKNYWVSETTYDRLLMFKFLPDYVDKAIYIDADIIVNGDLSVIYTNFNCSKLFASVVDIFFLKFKKKFYKYYSKFDEFKNWCLNPYKFAYFCAGFFIANINLSKKMKIFEQLIDIFKLHPSLKLADQDALNIIFSQKYNDKIIYLPLKYNLPADANIHRYMSEKKYYYSKKEIKEAFKNPIVIHYSGVFKPWKNYLILNFNDIWWKYYYLSTAKLNKIPHFKWRIYHLIRKYTY